MNEKYNYEKQHKKGKLHAMERIEKILDSDSFIEVGSSITHDNSDFGMDKVKTPYDGVITGYGKINNRIVGIYSQDFTIMGGSLGKKHGEKISGIIKKCIEMKCPVIGINDSGGARIQEGVHSLAGYGDIFYYNTLASGYIPQISVIAGPCAGGAVYSPGLTDFVFVIDDVSNMYVTGPKVVKSVTNQSVTSEQLGGARMHSSKSGVSHNRFENEEEAYKGIRKLLDLIPHYYGDYHNNGLSYEKPNSSNNDINYKFDDILPEKSNRVYDMHEIIDQLVDGGSFYEVHKEFAKNCIVCFGKINGQTVGIVANQPNYMAGVIDLDASDKMARFIRYCDAFDIPIVTLTDVPGFMPGLEQEEKGIIRHGAKLLYAYSEASVPKINVIIRKAFGGAYIAMSSKHLRSDFVFAWPTAEIAVMGAEGAVDVLFNKEFRQAKDYEGLRREKIDEYNESFLNPEIAAKHGYVDEIIEPSETRRVIIKSLELLKDKQVIRSIKKKHGNIPL